MPALVWNQNQTKRYETGVDQGVVYIGTSPGVVWNGLISVEQESDNGSAEESFYEGAKFYQRLPPGNFNASVSSFSIPKELRPCVGEAELRPGVYVFDQPKSRFNFTYRTLYESGDIYKIHLIYNAMMTQTDGEYSTLGEDAEPTITRWSMNALPEVSDLSAHPTAHFVIDSSVTNPAKLLALTDFLYGTGVTDPKFPTQKALFLLLN